MSCSATAARAVSTKVHVLISDSSFRTAMGRSYSDLTVDSTRRSTVSELPPSLRERAEDSISQLHAAVAEYNNVCYANSLGLESMVLTDLIWEAVPQIEIFSIDTGRLFPETYDLIERLQQPLRPSAAHLLSRGRALEDWVGSTASTAFATASEAAPRLLRGAQGRAVSARHRRARSLGYRDPARPVGEPRSGRPGRMGCANTACTRSARCSTGPRRKSGTTSAGSGCPTMPCTTPDSPSIGCAPCTRAVQSGRGRALGPLVVGARRFARMRLASAPQAWAVAALQVSEGQSCGEWRQSADLRRPAMRRGHTSVNYFPVFFDLKGRRCWSSAAARWRCARYRCCERTGARITRGCAARSTLS